LYSLVQSAFLEAIDCFKKCAGIFSNVKGESNFEYATAINNIGLVLYHTNDFQSALEHWEKAVAILSSLGMQSHPETANTYKSMAYCYEKLGLVTNAIFNIDRAINILNENNLENSEAALEYRQIRNRICRNDI
jgi:tetratricopeptide (TPR) repeat protein